MFTTLTPKHDAFVDSGPVQSETVSDYDRKQMKEALRLLREAEFEFATLKARIKAATA